MSSYEYSGENLRSFFLISNDFFLIYLKKFAEKRTFQTMRYLQTKYSSYAKQTFEKKGF